MINLLSSIYGWQNIHRTEVKNKTLLCYDKENELIREYSDKNIHEVCDDIKLWGRDNEYSITSCPSMSIVKTLVSLQFCIDISDCDTEYESIIKAGEWILKNKGE